MFRGETITVITRTPTSKRDDGNNTIYTTETTTVENVLVVPSTTDDVQAGNREDGVTVMFLLHFPKTYTASLKGAQIQLRDLDPLEVIGDPQPYTTHLTPGTWNRPVKIGRTDG